IPPAPEKRVGTYQGREDTLGLGRLRINAQKTRLRPPSDSLPVYLAGEFIDGLLCARPIGMHFKKPAEGFESRLLLANLTQNLRKTFKGLEVIWIERKRSTKVAQRAREIVLHIIQVGPAIPTFCEVGR